MGHIINPSAMRVGTIRYWEDFWYKDNLYYPEFLHQIFKMRFFLKGFFGLYLFERKNVFFSHFYFVYQHKSLNVKIFLYIGYVEFFFNNFNLENTLSFNSVTGKFLKTNARFYVIFLLFLKIYLKINFKNLFKLNKFFRFLIRKKKSFIKVFFSKIKYKNKNILLFILLIFLNQDTKLEDLFEFWWIIVKYVILMPKFKYIKLFIDNLFNYIFNAHNIECTIFSISNENLNARFLAKFIAKRLQQGFSIRQVIRPIIKDLLRTNKFSTAGDLEIRNNLNNNKLLFKTYLNKFKVLFKYVLNNNTWITIEYFNLFIIMNKLKYSIVIQVLKKYWKNMDYYYYYLNYLIQNYYYLNNNNNKYFENLFKSFKSSKKIFFDQKIFFLNNFLIHISFIFLNWFIKLQYLNFCGNDLEKQQKKIIKKSLCLLGFKLHFVGRFSRRQRASSIWFMQGKVPLNTLNAQIEFGYYTISLLNSAVRVKIYLNRGIAYNEYWMKIV